MTTTACLFALLLLLPFCAGTAWAGDGDETAPRPGEDLRAAQVTKFARVALAGITREYPNKPGNVMASAADVRSPRAMHPAFYGCFDWHSAVHGHWTLVRLLRLHPTWTEARAEVVKAVGANLTAKNLAAEAAYFDGKYNASFERTYGWAWLLRLAQELRAWDDDLGRAWARNLRPLETRIVALAKAYLPKLRIPIRSGQHTDTAFGLAFFLDYARAVKDTELEALCLERAKHYYTRDTDYPTRYEPSGHDFFSAGLNAADLMRRVLAPEAFATWIEAYLPTLATGALGPWTEPASVEDVTDGHLVHLAGLNLTRAWTMRGIAAALPAKHAGRAHLERLAQAHTEGGLGYVFSGDYAGEHWLGSFAVFLLTDAGLAPAR
ncbi:MAG: DUF2891 domain-containing protein [Planctomycetota bacterium]|nr:DUF2891 domain-containing protein [Planctomycetota bacterium]